MIQYAKNDRISVPKLGEVFFRGSIGERFEKVIFERITSEKAMKVIFEEADNAFDSQLDDKDAPLGVWRGEFWGKLMICACRACKYTGDEELLEFLKKSTYRMMARQNESGYIGTYKNPEMVFQCNPFDGKKAIGWECNWNWNIWCRKYTLWGMLEAYELIGDLSILDCAVRFADQLIEMLDKMNARICETGTFFGVASGSVMKPMLKLYRHTEDKRYLDFAIEIANEWEDNETCCAKLIKNSLDGMPVHLWYTELKHMEPMSRKPGTDEPAFDSALTKTDVSGKVYETLSCFDGLLELYRITGVKKYFTASERFFELLIKHEYNTIFSVGFNDVFLNASNYQNTITEVCDVLHFMRFATELYKLTAEPRYIDFAELAFYNAFLAGVLNDGSWAARGVRPSYRHLYSLQQTGCNYNHCCTDNMPKGFINMAETIAMSNENGVYINFYSDAEVTLHPTEIEDVHITIGEGYLQYCETDIVIDATLSEAKLLKLRIPQWSIETEISVNGKTYYPDAGEYFEIKMTSGETKLHVKFDNSPRLVEFDHDPAVYPTTPYMLERYFSGEKDIPRETVINSNRATLCVGPLLLSGCRGLGSTKQELFESESVYGKNVEVNVTPMKTCGYRAVYEVELIGKEFNRKLKMCDFASASDMLMPEEFWFNIFI